MRTLLIDARDTISSVDPTPSVFVQPSTSFISPLPLSLPAPILYLTFIGSCSFLALYAGVMTFTGSQILFRHTV